MAVTARHVPLSRVIVGDDEIESVVEVLRSGNLRQGEQCRAFETEFASAVGAKFALATNSGTAALQMAYQALLDPGDEVLVPAFTFFATASMVVAAGGTPIFCDVDSHTFTLDVEDASRRLSSRTRAIAPVHLFGNPADVIGIVELARANKLAVVWDAAQAHLASFEGRDVGSLDDVTCYSFYPSKNMTTGEGGMVCTNSEELHERMKLLRSQGQARKYHHTALGFNFRMTDIQAAIGRHQLRKISGWTQARRANAEYLRARLGESSAFTIQREQPAGRHVYHQFSLLLDESLNRDQFVADLLNFGIESGVHYPLPLHRQPFFSDGSAPELPVSEGLARRILSVPVHPYLSSEDREYVADRMLELVA